MQSDSYPDNMPLSRIEREVRCESCHHILYAMPVTADAKTGIPVVRCLECGTVQAAATIPPAPTWWRKLLGASRFTRSISVIFFFLISALLAWNIGDQLRFTRWHLSNDVRLEVAMASGGLLVSSVLLSAYVYRPRFIVRLAIFVLIALAANIGPHRGTSPLAIAIELAIPALVALWCRPILRGIVRVMLPNQSRYVFEGLWQADNILVKEGPW